MPPLRHSQFDFFRRLQTSLLLFVSLIVMMFAHASVFLFAQTAETVSAHTSSLLSEARKYSQQAETRKAASTASQEAPAQTTPTPATSAPEPAAAPTPVKKVASQPAVKQSQQTAVTPTPATDWVSIPSVGLSSQFVTVGKTSANAVDVHPSLAGWFKGSAKLGTPGAAFLDGHNPGVFSALPRVRAGAQISINTANGETFNYTVVHTETIPLVSVNMVNVLSTYGGAGEGLNLMTCVGTYNPRTGTTDQRFIVYAVRS